MLKRNFYILLSSVVAVVAVLGWIGPHGDGFNGFGNASDVTGQAVVELGSEAEAASDLYEAADRSVLLTLSELSKNASLEAYLSADSPTLTHIRLFGPETAPKLDTSTIVVDKLAQGRAALSSLAASESLAKAKLIAIVDIDTGEVLVSSDVTLAERVLMKLRTQERESGDILYQLDEGSLMQVAWHCVGVDKSRCLLSVLDARIAVEGELACRLTGPLYALDCDALSGDGAIIDTTDAFLTSGCPQNVSAMHPELRSAAFREAANSAENVGQFVLEAQRFNYKKQVVNHGCTLIAMSVGEDKAAKAAAMPVSPTTATPTHASAPQVQGLYSPRVILMAVFIGLFMGILGLLLLRAPRPKPSKIESPEQEEQKQALERALSENNRIALERDRLKVQVLELKGQVLGLEDKNTRLHNEMRQIEARCQELENDKLQLLEALSERPKPTTTDSLKQARLDDDASALPRVSLIDLDQNPESHGKYDVITSRQTEELPVVNLDDILLKEEDHQPDLPTSELNSSDIAAVISSEHPSIHDYFPDDAWDEIAASFDAIITDNKTGLRASPPPPELDFLDNEANPEASVFGMTNFLESVRESDQRVTQDRVTQTKSSETPIGLHSLKSPQKFSSIPQKGIAATTSKGLPKLPTAPASARSFGSRAGDSNLPQMPGSGLNKQATSERQITETAADLATKKPSPGENAGFKPAPSWTGQRAQDNVGMDQNSLLDALKRRTKDVSEIQNAVTDPSKPQAFEYNRALSKSGVFSMTGSRVDINPNSDTETFKSLYDRFVESQRETGETSDRFTLEQFVNRLAREKEQLLKAYKCKDVRFQVYVKDGKTSLKATPVK